MGRYFAGKGGIMKFLILGGDGFCGWRTSLHLSQSGHDVTIVDTLSRRCIDVELEVESLTPLRPIHERLNVWKDHTGKEIKLDMKVVGTGKNKAGTTIFLNSADRKSPENFTVMIDKKGIDSLKKAGVTDPAMAYKGKTVHVVGVVTSYMDRHEIVISDAAKIKLVEKE